jgi:murein DD-endopeptidase MepM/ murein hydrolase activator NlpD
MNYEMVKKIYSSDKSILEELQANYDLINEKKQELDNLQAGLISQKQEQLALQDELKADKAAVAKKKGIVSANNDALEDNISDLKQEAANIEALIKKDQESSGSGGSGGSEYTEGQFSWPVPGWSRVSSDYGWRVCPFHGNEFHTGIDIPAGYGEAVVAAASGTVISACYQGSYGNAVLISHGGGLYTLYAHNSSLIVYAGQKVSKGQQIARIGSTGSSTGNHLHFEVRNGASYGSDVSPWGYLK